MSENAPTTDPAWLDPADDAPEMTDELFEIKFGMKPADMRSTFQEIQQERINRKELAEAKKKAGRRKELAAV